MANLTFRVYIYNIMYVPAEVVPCIQDFYNEQLEDDFRKSRYLDLARKDGMPVGKVERQLSEGKAGQCLLKQLTLSL